MSRATVLALVALGAAAAAAFPAFAQDAPAGVRGRMLSWPGKRDRAVMAPAYVAPTAARTYAGQVYAPPAVARTYAARPSGWRNEASTNSALSYAPRIYPGSVPAREPYADRPYAQQAPSARVGPAPQPYGPSGPTASGASERRAYAPAQDGWRPVFADAGSSPPKPVPAPAAPPALAGAPTRSKAPTSIYVPATAEMTPAQRAAAAPPPLRTASAAQRYGYDPSQGHQVRFYSVHRAFGLQPDAVPIPPQFFTASADLSEPAGPLPTDRTTTTTTASGTRVSHVAPDTSSN